MKNSSEHTGDLVQKFLLDQLTESEGQEVQSLIKDSDFQKKLDFNTDIYEALSENRVDELRTVIQEARNERSHANTTETKDSDQTLKNEKSGYKSIVMALGLIGTAALLFFLSPYFISEKPKNIFADYYQPYPTEKVERGNTNQSIDDYNLAISKYASKDYQESLDILLSLSEQSPKIKMYQAICHLELGKAEEAKTILDTLQDNPDTKLSQQAEWYLSLSYLKLNDMNNFKDHIKGIAESKYHLYQAKAKEILGRI